MFSFLTVKFDLIIKCPRRQLSANCGYEESACVYYWRGYMARVGCHLKHILMVSNNIRVTSHKERHCHPQQRGHLLKVMSKLTKKQISKLSIIVPLWGKSTGDWWTVLEIASIVFRRIYVRKSLSHVKCKYTLFIFNSKVRPHIQVSASVIVRKLYHEERALLMG